MTEAIIIQRKPDATGPTLQADRCKTSVDRAQKAKDYGSHTPHFEIPVRWYCEMIRANGDVDLSGFCVAANDIWRAASAARAPIEDWVQSAPLIVKKPRLRGQIFWLGPRTAAHEPELIAYVGRRSLSQGRWRTSFQIMSPAKAGTRQTLEDDPQG